MHRLAVLKHDVVCDIDNVVDRAHAGAADALAHPGGRGRDLHIFHHTRGVARAEIGVLDDDFGQVVDVAAGFGLYKRRVQLQFFMKGRRRFARKADDAKAVRAVGRDFKLHDMVVKTEERGHVVAGLHILVQHKDAVMDTVRKFALLGTKIVEGADVILRRVISDQVSLMEVLTIGHGLGLRLQAQLPAIHAGVFHRGNARGHHLAEHTVTRLDVGGNGGLFRVDGVIVAQNRGRLNHGVGEIVLGGLQLLERAEHAVGGHAAELSFRDLCTVRQQCVVQRCRHQVAHMDVPGAGADLHRLFPADVELSDQHMVGVRVLFQRKDAPDLHVFHPRTQILGDLHF